MDTYLNGQQMMKIVMATHEYSMSAALNKISRFANKNWK